MLGILLIVTLTVKTDTDAVGNILDTLGPDSLVKLRVDTDVLGAHLLQDEGLNGLDGGGGALLERLAMDVFVEVDGALTADNLRGDAALGSLGHLHING